MVAIIVGLAVIAVSAWIWSSRRFHDYIWDAVQRGPWQPGVRGRTRDEAVFGMRLAAALTAAAGAFSVTVGFVDVLS